jgi:hypothetical protein
MVKRRAHTGQPVIAFESADEAAARAFWRRAEPALQGGTLYLVAPTGVIVLSITMP